MKLRQLFFVISTLFLVIISSHSTAQIPSGITPAQIEQFKRLSPAEQEALARSFGINLNDYRHLLDGAGDNTQILPQETITPVRRPMPHSKTEGQYSNTPSVPGNDLEGLAARGTDELSLDEDESPESTNQSLSLFGYDIFDQGTEAFIPAQDIPVPADYVLGPGDTLIVQLYGKENSTEAYTLNREGSVLFDNIGPVNLAGMTFTQATERVNQIVSEQMIGVKSAVTMGTLRTIRVFVLGEVVLPGSYVISSLSTMTNAMFASGGVTKIGSLRNIQLKRKGKVITTLDLYDLLLNGDTAKDRRLLPGDVLFVPPIGKTIGISGEVKRPAIYELKNEETVDQAIKLAGGLLPSAYLRASRIERITPAGEKTLVNIDLTANNGKSFLVNDADVIQIFSTLDTMRDIVQVAGHVKRPGGFAWRPGLRLTDVIPSVDELLANPDIEIGLIQREEKETRKLSAVLFSPKLAFAKPGGTDDIKLESRDKIMMFDYETDRTEVLSELLNRLKTQANFDELQKTINISGEIRFPGEYPLAKNMTTQRLVALAGGLKESALARSAEITRRELDSNREQIAVHIEIDLLEQDYPLKEADHLRVKPVPYWRTQETVTISGEVIFPGTYTILPGETLRDLIDRAGGLTSYAYAPGAIFSRAELRELERQRLVDLQKQIESDIAKESLNESSKTDISAAEKILENLKSVNPLGRMVIDLPSLLEKSETYDFPLEDGDELAIPRYKPSVTVIGEVQYPTSHLHNRKLSVQDYIDRSGGTKEKADSKRTYVVKANGKVLKPSSNAWFKSRSADIEPGDTIVVPLDTDRVDPVTRWSSVTQIMYQAALGIAAIGSL